MGQGSSENAGGGFTPPWAQGQQMSQGMWNMMDGRGAPPTWNGSSWGEAPASAPAASATIPPGFPGQMTQMGGFPGPMPFPGQANGGVFPGQGRGVSGGFPGGTGPMPPPQHSEPMPLPQPQRPPMPNPERQHFLNRRDAFRDQLEAFRALQPGRERAAARPDFQRLRDRFSLYRQNFRGGNDQ